ncbi:hypothetical protein DSECCO2_311900 [anaerobic digester metagenome]
MFKKLTFLFVCCFFGIVSFALPSYAAQVSEIEIPDDQPDPDGSSFNEMQPGEVIIDDTAYMDRTMLDQSYPSSYTKDYNYQRGSVRISDSRLSNLRGRQGLRTLAFYIQQNFNHRTGGARTANGVVETGSGDCWGLSDFALHMLLRNGYTVRLLQGQSSASSRHRWLEVQLENGSWTTFDPSLVTEKYHFKPYWHRCAVKTAVLGVYYP